MDSAAPMTLQAESNPQTISIRTITTSGPEVWTIKIPGFKHAQPAPPPLRLYNPSEKLVLKTYWRMSMYHVPVTWEVLLSECEPFTFKPNQSWNVTWKSWIKACFLSRQKHLRWGASISLSYWVTQWVGDSFKWDFVLKIARGPQSPSDAATPFSSGIMFRHHIGHISNHYLHYHHSWSKYMVNDLCREPFQILLPSE